MSFSREFYFERKLDLLSSPEALWPFVSDTDRFNRDAGLPAIKILKKEGIEKLIEMNAMGIKILWREIPFDWVAPNRFSVSRIYLAGPLRDARVTMELSEKAEGGCVLRYQFWVRPANWLGFLTIPFALGIDFMSRAERVFRMYDSLAGHKDAPAVSGNPVFSPSVRARLEILREKLLEAVPEAPLTERLFKYLEESGDFALQRIRPYVLADTWQVPRRAVLEMFLHATRIGLLQFRWEVLCPLCRGPENEISSLSRLQSQAHCAGCNIDYTVNFEQLVELAFKPTPSVRPLAEEALFCAGSPQMTPHIAAQLTVSPGKTKDLLFSGLKPGRYRARISNQPGGQLFNVSENGADSAAITLGGGWPDEEVSVKKDVKLVLHNPAPDPQRFIFERMAWSDTAVTAREVILMPLFRDLFAREALRPGEKISVGSVAIVFTDLRGSTKMYRDIGDAVAFGTVMDHFEIIFKAFRDENGVLIKTIGDAVMAVFSGPESALRAAIRAQRELVRPGNGRMPLRLKAGIHFGPCIAVTENEKLDYFGTAVNLAARLTGFSSGEDIVISGNVYQDPAAVALLPSLKLSAEPFQAPVKGFENEAFSLYKVK